MRVLLIADDESWILGEIARRLAAILSRSMNVTVVASCSKGFDSTFNQLQKRYDIVHFLTPWPFFRLERHVAVPCVLTLWHMVDWKPFELHSHRLDALCVASQQWLELAGAHLPPNIPVKRVIHGLDAARFTRDPGAKAAFLGRANLAEDTLVFGFAGKASSNEGDRKGIDRLWLCFLSMQRQTKAPIILRIIGPQWPTDMIPAELMAVVRIEGEIPGAQLPEFYSSLDYYVCASREEGVPYPVLEAMSCECVVLTTAVGVVPEVVRHNANGIVLRAECIENDFVEAVASTAPSGVRRAIGQSARETVTSKMDWDIVVKPEDYLAIYKAARSHFISRPILRRWGFAFQSSRFYSISQNIRSRLRPRARLKRIVRFVFELTKRRPCQ